MTRLLQPPEHHDGDQAPHVQAVGRGIEADVGGDDSRARALIEGRGVGLLMDVAALDERAQEVGFEFSHGSNIKSWRAPLTRCGRT